MEKSNIIAKIYGYLICLTAVITFLICITSLVNSLIDLGDPIHSEKYSHSQNYSSFESYKMDIIKEVPESKDSAVKSYIPDDKTLQAMYETAKAEKISVSMHNIKKNITADTILIVICIVLFAVHWKWLRKLANASA